MEEAVNDTTRALSDGAQCIDEALGYDANCIAEVSGYDPARLRVYADLMRVVFSCEERCAPLLMGYLDRYCDAVAGLAAAYGNWCIAVSAGSEAVFNQSLYMQWLEEEGEPLSSAIDSARQDILRFKQGVDESLVVNQSFA